jgi:hypothetical protein
MSLKIVRKFSTIPKHLCVMLREAPSRRLPNGTTAAPRLSRVGGRFLSSTIHSLPRSNTVVMVS